MRENFMVRDIKLLGLLLAASLVFEGAAQAQAPAPAPAVAVHIVNSANNTLAVTTIEPRLSWPLVLQRSDTDDAAAPVQIDLTHLMSVSGRPQQVTLQDKDGAAHDGKLILPARGQAILRVAADVPEEGAYKGEIVIVVGGKRTPIAFSVTRAVREVVVVGASGGALQVTTPDPALQWPIVIRRNDNAEGPRNVGVELASLIAPSQQAVALELRNGATPVTATTPISLGPLGQVTLNLIGNLTEDGIHNGEISLVVDGKRLSTALKITRNLKDSAVRIEDIAQVHTTVDSAGVGMHLRLQEAEGRETTVEAPTLVKLDRKEGTALIQADYKKLNMLGGGTPPPNMLVLEPHKTLDLALQIEGLTTPGNYAGVLRISSPTRKPADKAFELSLRRGIGCAIVLIIGGVLLSTGARAYYTLGRSAMVAQGDAITVRDDLLRFRTITPDLTIDEKRVLSHLSDRLDAVRLGNANTDLGKPEDQVGEIRRKVELLFRWIDLRRKLGEVKPDWVGDKVRPKHLAVMQVLDKDGATEAETKKALDNLETYNSELDTAVKDELKSAIEAMQKEIISLTTGQMLTLQDTSDALATALAEAEAGNQEAAASKLTAARHAYVQVAIKGLSDSLDPGKPAPGFTAQDWAAVVADYNRRLNLLQAMSDAEQKVREWNKLRIEWLHAIAQPLLRKIEEEDKRAAGIKPPATPDPNAPDPDAARANYANAKAALDSIDKLLLEKKFQDANKAYTTAIEAFAKGRAAMTDPIQMSGPTAMQAPAQAPTDGGVVPDDVIQGAWNLITFALRAPVTAAQANNRVLIAEGLLFLLMLALALAIGLKFLYFDNAAWGSYIDLTVAFLWGFGLHQVGGTAFQGVQSIAQQIAGK
jgi:hypothetical protein